MELRRTAEDELRSLAEFAAPLQSRDDSHIVYLGTGADGILAELSDTTWSEVSVVAVAADVVVGWLIGDVDSDMGRVWWFGPFASGEAWESAASALLAAGREQLPAAVTEEEMAVDARFETYCRWAVTEGFTAEEGAYVLDLDGPLDPPTRPVREIASGDRDSVVRLHEESFPGTHTTGEQLVDGHDDTHRRLVADVGGTMVGYVAVEIQSDGSGYIDYVGVEPAARRSGLGSDLVRAGVAELRRLGADGVGLTVRAGNAGGRELYTSLGFREVRLAVPFRRGFSIP